MDDKLNRSLARILSVLELKPETRQAQYIADELCLVYAAGELKGLVDGHEISMRAIDKAFKVAE